MSLNGVEMFQYFRSDIVRIRQTILDTESDLKINAPKGARNTHNALVLVEGTYLHAPADVKAIKKIEVADPKRSVETFCSLYDLSFGIEDVENLLDHLVKCCNHKAFVTPSAM